MDSKQIIRKGYTDGVPNRETQKKIQDITGEYISLKAIKSRAARDSECPPHQGFFIAKRRNGIIGRKTTSSLQSGEKEMNYLITTIQGGASVNHQLLQNMLLFAKRHNVEKIYVYVMQGKNKEDISIAPSLQEEEIIEFVPQDKRGIVLNSNLKLYHTGILASQINPLTGFSSKLHRDFSYVLPSPKIRYQSIANTSKYPRFLATTGALTHSNYKLHIAQGRKAELEHEYGFAFVRIKNTRKFDYQPVMALKNGNFNFGREHYHNGEVYDQQPEALVLGDWHTGDTCQKTRQVSVEMIEELKPKRVFFHDLFNGHSVNHHERSNNLSKAQLWSNDKHVLHEEVNQCRNELNWFATQFPDVEFLVVESNHDLFMAQYIGNENFLIDGQNSLFACQLFVAVSNKQQPILKTAMELLGEVKPNVRFLNEDEEYRVKGVALDYHGHRGVNGARGSGASFDRYNLRMITAHEHTPKIYANGMVVGTSTHLKLPYTKGASSWLNAHGLLFASGKYTLLTIVH